VSTTRQTQNSLGIDTNMSMQKANVSGTKKAPCPGVAGGCGIPTGVPGIVYNVPGVDCSACTPTITPGQVTEGGKQAVVAGITGGNPQQSVQEQMNTAIANGFQPLFNKIPVFGIKMGLFMFAFMLVIIGLWTLTRNPVKDASSTLTTGLNNVATSAGKHVGKHVAKVRHKNSKGVS
jgi:hypothetical protein